MTRFHLTQLRYFLSALVSAILAVCAEAAVIGQVDGAGNAAFQHDAAAFALHLGVGQGNGTQQSLRIGMQRLIEQLLAGGQFYYASSLRPVALAERSLNRGNGTCRVVPIQPFQRYRAFENGAACGAGMPYRARKGTPP